MKPTAIFKGMIVDMRKQGRTIDYELAERNTRILLREESVEEQTSGLVDSFKTNAEDTFFVGWPIIEEDCPYAELVTKCDPICVSCDMKHVCMHCALKSRSAEPSVDPPCPLRIPGCRCSTGAGPSILKYYCNAGDRFMGANVQGAGDEEFLEKEIEDEESFEGETEEEEDDELLGESGNERLFKEIGGEVPLDDENEGEEFVEDEIQRLYSPQSLWPLSAMSWKGLIPGWEQGLPPPFQPQVDYNDNSNFSSESPTSGPQSSVAAGPYARGGRAQSSMDVSQFPTAYNVYSPFLLESPELHYQNPTTASQRQSAEEIPSSRMSAQSPVTYSGYSSLPESPNPNNHNFAAASPSCTPVRKVPASRMYAQYPIACSEYSPFLSEPPGLKHQDSEAASQKAPAGKAPSSRKPVTEQSRPRVSHKEGATNRHVAVGEARSSQEPATKKDSRGWEDHEKELVKTLMQEVILEGTYSRTEERWKIISRRLSSRYSVDRTWTAVKNYWNRCGRSDTNIDERKVKKPDRMITGVQDPESRRKARKTKRKEAECDISNNLADLDDDSGPSSKRQRQ